MQTRSVMTLAAVVTIFFFTSNISGNFLTIYYHEELHMSIPEIAEILLFTFPLIGLLPMFLLKTAKNFERIISYGIFLTTIYVVLIFVRDPIVLGLVYGLSIATFWPSFNLLLFRLSESSHVPEQ